MFEVLKKKENEKLMIVIVMILTEMFIVLGQILLLSKLNIYLIDYNINKYIIPIITLSTTVIFLIFDYIAIGFFSDKKLKTD